MDFAAQAAMEAQAILCGRLPSVEDTYDIAALLVRAFTAPEATAMAAEAARAAYVRLFRSDAHGAEAIAALLSPASRQALVAALEGGGHAALKVGHILFQVVCLGSRSDGLFARDTCDRIAGTDGMIESMVHALQRATQAARLLPEAPVDHNLRKAVGNLCFVLSRFIQCEGCAAHLLAAPGAVGALAAAGRMDGAPIDYYWSDTIVRMFGSMITVLGADAARALMAEEGALHMIVQAVGRKKNSF
jgi:hypothetical protein